MNYAERCPSSSGEQARGGLVRYSMELDCHFQMTGEFLVKPQNGDTVRVHYTGTLADGTEFDSSQGRDPLSFTMGEESVIPGFEAAVAELEVGGKTTVTIPAAQAYGERIDDAQQEVPLDAFGDSLPQAGWGVELQGPDGQRVNAIVAAIGEEFVTLDFNHPLAGQDLTFELELVQIVNE